jgi:group I intron endonuclease
MNIHLRTYTTLLGNPLDNNDINHVKIYEDAYDMRKNILKENKGKSGIYMLTNKLNPQYNILKIAGSSKDFKRSEETKTKISKSLKGIYVKEKSALFGSSHTEETKKLMSLKKVKDNNPLFGKTHSKDYIELMRQKALGITHSEETK